jgi:hypothetical protein
MSISDLGHFTVSSSQITVQNRVSSEEHFGSYHWWTDISSSPFSRKAFYSHGPFLFSQPFSAQGATTMSSRSLRRAAAHRALKAAQKAARQASALQPSAVAAEETIAAETGAKRNFGL